MDKPIITIVSAVGGAVIGALVVTLLGSQPQVPASTAQIFFDNYYGQVTQAGQRKILYEEDLTKEFRIAPNGDWHDYNNWWQGEKQVVVNSVQSVPGNPLAFNVWLTYYPRGGGKTQPQPTVLSLVCNGSWASLVARIPTFGCPVGNLQIQSGLNATSAQ